MIVREPAGSWRQLLTAATGIAREIKFKGRHVGIQPRRLARMIADAGADANAEFWSGARRCYHLSFHPNLSGDAPGGSWLVLYSRVSADLEVTYASSHSQWIDFLARVLLEPVMLRYTGDLGVCVSPCGRPGTRKRLDMVSGPGTVPPNPPRRVCAPVLPRARFPMLVPAVTIRSWGGCSGSLNPLVGFRAEPMLSRPPPVSLKAKHAIRARRIVPCNSLTAWGGGGEKKARLEAVRVHASYLSSPPPPRKLGGGTGFADGCNMSFDDELTVQAAEQR